jgi:hypothetical protein
MFSTHQLIITSLILFSGQVFAGNSSDSDSINYDIDSRLSYLDGFESPTSSSAAMLVEEGSARPRSLGLSKMRLGIEWSNARSSSFRIALRPDVATNRDQDSAESKSKEYDTRIGSTYRSSEGVNFLDEYQIIFHSGKRFDVEVGVFDKLVPDPVAFDQIMEFGLNVRLPRKFSGLKFVGSFLNQSENLAMVEMQTGLQTTLTVFQGDNDRAELFASDNDRQDRAPHAADPYMGGFAKADWTPSPLLHVSLGAGAIDSAVTPSGKLNELFTIATLGWDLPIGSRWVKAMFSYRSSKESWRVEDDYISDLVQQSAALSLALQMSQRSRFLFSTQVGRSERHKLVSSTADGVTTEKYDNSQVDPVSGFSVNMGFDSTISNGLIASFALSHEERTQTIDDEEIGAFENEDGFQKSLRRIGLTIKYQLNGNR